MAKATCSALMMLCFWTTFFGETSSSNTGSVAVNTRVWYVSTRGNDENNQCSQASSPCQTFEHLPSRIKDGGRINLYGTPNQTNTFLSCKNWNLTLSDTLELLGNGSRPVFGCQDKAVQNFKLVFTSEDGGQGKLVLQNLIFRNVDVILDAVHLELVECEFANVNLKLTNEQEDNVIGLGPPMDVVISHSHWQGTVDCLDEYQLQFQCCNTVLVRGNITLLDISNTEFLQYQLNITLTTDAQVTFDNIHISNSPDMEPMLGGIFLNMTQNTQQTKVLLQNSILEKQFYWAPLQGMLNFHESAFLVDLESHFQKNNVTMVVQNCTFSNNGRAITLVGFLQHMLIDSCVFESNKAMHGGAAILLLTEENNSNIHIRNCTFTNNAAGHIREDILNANKDDPIIVDGDEVRINSSCCKGTMGLVGKGGAVRIRTGNLKLENCSFVNNTARILGGSLYVDTDGNLTITDCQFMNTADRRKLSQQGDIIYSIGQKVEINDIRLLAQASSSHVSLLHHSGSFWSMMVHDITIQCPVGYGLRRLNSSATRMHRDRGLGRSYGLDQLSYFCKSCPRHKYSTDRGFLHYQVNGSNISFHYTVLFNGETPQPAFNELDEFRDIQCKECPYGGNCDDNLRALPNFWGYDQGGDITFQLCPSGYCCPKAPCPAFNSCAHLRTGSLCGNCLDGYTEAVYSTKCVPDEDCGHSWMWAFAFSTGILYALLLLFQDDIRAFIFVFPKGIIDFHTRMCKKTWSDQKVSHYRDSNGGTTHPMMSSGEVENFWKLCGAALDKETSACGETSATKKCKHPQTKTDIGEVLLIIVMYYFQDAMLFQIKTPFSELQVKEHSILQRLLLSLFDFHIDISAFVENACLVPGLSPSQKILALAAFVPYVFLLFAFLYTLRVIKPKIWKTGANKPSSMSTTRLSTAFMLAILFMYQQVATAAFTLLNCVPVGNHRVLFIEGSVRCYQIWQYVVMAYVVVGVVPFFAILLIGPGLLREGRVGLRSFFLACLFPLPFVVYWVRLRLQRKGLDNDFQMPPECEAIEHVLQGPFKVLRIPWLGPICWAGVVIFRRLILIIFFTFIGHSLVRVMIMWVACFFVFVLHMQVKPYKDKVVNATGSMSISALMIVGGINFVYAGFQTAEYTPQGPNKTLIHVMQNSESILLLWLPLVIMSIIILALVLKTIYVIVKGLSKVFSVIIISM